MIPELTLKEKEIMTLLAKGLLYKEIAIECGIQIDTVKKHATNVYKKLKVRNKTEALLLLQPYIN